MRISDWSSDVCSSDLLGQPIVVKNQAGANGSIGSAAVARAPADGYTILVGSIGTHAANECLYKLPYDPVKDFTTVALLAKYNDVVMVRADSPIKSLAIGRASGRERGCQYSELPVGAGTLKQQK